MEYLREKLNNYNEVVVSEYICPKCDMPFWVPQTSNVLRCPFCGAVVEVNGNVLLKGNKRHKTHKKI